MADSRVQREKDEGKEPQEVLKYSQLSKSAWKYLAQ
jgi:hypothetical protein